MFIKKTLYNCEFEFLLIENIEQLNFFCDQINSNDILAIDTEFTRKSTYYPILSTIQIALKQPAKLKKLVLIDVIKCSNISKIINIINKPQITKIFHCSLQDLQIFYNISKQFPKNICDTQIMANFCQEPSNIGYSNLVKNLFSVEICKKMQNSDWQSRPLNQSQIDYAMVDVLFLHEIYENFLQILNSRKQFDWFVEEMNDYIDKILSDNSPNLIKSFQISKLDKLEINRLNKLIILREKFAQIYNLPREHLLKNLDLLNIAKFDKNNFNEENLPQYLSKEFKKIIGEEIANNDILPSIELPIKLNLIDKKNIDKIKSLIAKISKKIQFNEQFLLNNNQIKNIVINNNVKNSINGWRYQIFGNQIEQIIFNQHENNHRKLENEPRL